MLRFLFTVLMLTILLSVLLSLGVFPPAIHAVVAYVVGLVWSIGLPLFFVLYFFAPGLFSRFNADLSQFRARVRQGRREIEDLRQKIDHLDKPHHMVQLGHIYLQQGRLRKAAPLLEKALEKEPNSLDAQYKLALCYFAQGKYAEAAALLEKVHAVKPDHDYGVAYLRLAQSHHKLGNDARAGEVYELLLRFNPGHAEGAYHYALLLAAAGEPGRARELMQTVVTSVRRSPAFQRRRNRHWMWKAKWWLCCRGNGS